jgi:hypothetical protein
MPVGRPVYAARIRPTTLKTIFHIKRDSATFDNIAVPSGKGSLARVGLTGIIGFFMGW